MWVFDLDGTLVDTHEAVQQAYRFAGVEMPENAWGRPWREWMGSTTASPAFIHDLKVKAYSDKLRLHAQRLPLFDIVQHHGWPIITGASKESVEVVIGVFGGLNVVLTSASREEKVRWLDEHGPTGYYVDDDPVTRALVQAQSRWQAMTPEEALTCLTSPQ